MAIVQHLSVLAVRQVVDGACQALGCGVGAAAADAVVALLESRFHDHSLALSQALHRANERAWRALELALAGTSWWQQVYARLSRADERALGDQVRAFLDSAPLSSLPSHDLEARRQALRDLRTARSRGLLSRGGAGPALLAEQAGRFARYASPQSVLDAEWQMLNDLAAGLREAGLSALAQLIGLRPRDGVSLLALAARYFFRREVETTPALFQGLAFAKLEQLEQAQEQGFEALHAALQGYADKLGDMLLEVQEVAVETRADVKDIKAALAQHGRQLQAVGEAVFRTLAQPAPAQGPGKEHDPRLEMLNTLLTTPHRRLDLIWPVHQQLVGKDPRFYVHLAAWYHDKGEVRDHKEMFIVTLALSDFEGHRDVGLALLRTLPPYQVVRVVDFIHGRKETRRVRKPAEQQAKVPHKQGQKSRKAAPAPAPKGATVREVVGDFGLFRNVPKSLCTEVQRYLREREANPDWFDGTVLVARKAMKRLYAVLHVPPGPRAQQILFDDRPPPDSRVHALKHLARSSPEEQARAIVESRIPFRIAISVIPQMTPALLEGLIERMSPQELINSLGTLQRYGALTNPDLKAMIDLKLEEARSNARVSTLKVETALQAVDVSEELRGKLEEVADARILARGRIRRPTALLVDKSGSMELAIEIGKRIAAMVSAACESSLHVYAFDTIAYPIEAKGRDWASWKKAFAGINAGGETSVGVAVDCLRRKQQHVEQIIVVTDEEEYNPPFFVESLLKYRQALGADPAVCFVKVPDSSQRLEEQCKRAGIVASTFDFNGDYYSLPNLLALLEPPSGLDLLMEIMDYPLPERRPS
jgi:hypothetical protein